MFDLIRNRTSCRSYLDKPIELEKINQIKVAINNSPTARNLQDFSCIFITDPQVRERLYVYADKQSHVKIAPLFILFLSDQNCLNTPTNWSEVDATIAATSAMFAAEAIGLQTCMIGRIVHHEKEINELLHIRGKTKIVLGLTVGYAQNKSPHSIKVNRCNNETYDLSQIK